MTIFMFFDQNNLDPCAMLYQLGQTQLCCIHFSVANKNAFYSGHILYTLSYASFVNDILI